MTMRYCSVERQSFPSAQFELDENGKWWHKLSEDERHLADPQIAVLPASVPLDTHRGGGGTGGRLGGLKYVTKPDARSD